MKAKHTVIAAVLAITVLGGACGSKSENVPFAIAPKGEPAAVEITTTTVAPTTTTVAPTTTEPPTTTTDTISPDNHEAPMFLAAIRRNASWLDTTSDSDLVDLAANACAAIITGDKTYDEALAIFQGQDDYDTEGAWEFMFTIGVLYFCPDQDPS